MNPIAKKIHDARLKAKMSEKELAKKCGLAASYITQIESGKKIINEDVATTILAVFGDTMESTYSAFIEEAEKASGTDPKKTPPKPVPAKPAPAAEQVQVEPNPQWAGALANIIKQFQIKDMRSDKSVGQKELPVLNRKIEGVPWEKLLFFMASDDDGAGMRIKKGDILWVQEMKDVQVEGIYLLDWQNKRQLCRVQKHYGKLILSKGAADAKPVTVELKDVRIVGRGIKVEFAL